MSTYEALYIDKQVSQRLRAHKEMLEETYKLKLTWSHFLYLLIKNNQAQEITISDIMETPESILEFGDLIYDTAKPVNLNAKK